MQRSVGAHAHATSLVKCQTHESGAALAIVASEAAGHATSKRQAIARQVPEIQAQMLAEAVEGKEADVHVDKEVGKLCCSWHRQKRRDDHALPTRNGEQR